MNDPLLEQLAAHEHDQWAAWTRHFLANQTPENIERWQRQLATPYDNLSETEKEADREWARKVLTLIRATPAQGEHVLFNGRHLTLKSRDGWEFVERPRTSGIVAILALTENREILLVEQFRAPVGKRVIELPAGLAGDIVGEENEDLARAAQRELLEETGYEAATMEWLTDGPPSAGLSTEFITFYHARGLKKVASGGGDASEDIIVHHVPFDHLAAWIEDKRKEGCLIDYKIYAALYFTQSQP